MTNRKEAPEVNAGSMADIAFLLLIFFLVTTVIETDEGLDRMLPRIDTSPPIDIHKRNLLEILLNDKGEILIEKELVAMENIKATATTFLDNGGAPPGDAVYCNYCSGTSDPTSSDSPSKAVISLSSHRQANYGTYITVQNELVGAYTMLRNREAQRLFGVNYTDIDAQFRNPATSESTKKSLKEKIRSIQELFPLNLVEAEIK